MKVLLFLAEGFEDLEAISILDIMGWTQYREWVPTLEVITTGFHHTIKSRFGLIMKPDIAFEQVNSLDYDALAIPGGFHSHGFDEAYDERLRELARKIHSHKKWIATFCVGVLPVAEADLLKNKKAVTYPHSRNHNNKKRLLQLGAQVINTSVIVDNHIMQGIEHSGRINLAKACELLPNSKKPTIKNRIKKLVVKELIISQGKGRASWYIKKEYSEKMYNQKVDSKNEA